MIAHTLSLQHPGGLRIFSPPLQTSNGPFFAFDFSFLMRRIVFWAKQCFKEPIEKIISVSSEKRQNLFFSATLPRAVVDTIHQMFPKREPFLYNCKESYEGVVSLVQRYILIPSQVKDIYLVHLLTTGPFASIPSIIIFVGKCK